jgi:hypothetical protein
VCHTTDFSLVAICAAPDASFRDVLLAIRADEANHREVNHTFANIEEDDYNPYVKQVWQVAWCRIQRLVHLSRRRMTQHTIATREAHSQRPLVLPGK